MSVSQSTKAEAISTRRMVAVRYSRVVHVWLLLALIALALAIFASLISILLDNIAGKIFSGLLLVIAARCAIPWLERAEGEQRAIE